MKDDKLFKALERIGSINIHYDEGGSGMGYYWSADNGNWPYCSASTLRGALLQLVAEHARLDAEKLRKQANAIEESAQL